ncbi:MAG: hypothetical protein JWN52_3030 [Actinomycetia bacterium]|nr:hypothetical protein [Actinomycetes bacterium]
MNLNRFENKTVLVTGAAGALEPGHGVHWRDPDPGRLGLLTAAARKNFRLTSPQKC